MFHCSFMFTPIARDEEFQRLDDAIADYARTLEGFLGSESWFSADKSKINAVYFFETMEAVRTFATFPTHLEAKKNMPPGTRGTRLSFLKFKQPTVMVTTTTSHRRKTKPRFFRGAKQFGLSAPERNGG